MSSSSDKSYHSNMIYSSTPLLKTKPSNLLRNLSMSTVEAHSSSSTAAGAPLNRGTKEKRRKKRQESATKPRKTKRRKVAISSDSDWETGSEQTIQEEANSSKSNQGAPDVENSVLLKDIRGSIRGGSILRSPSEEDRPEQPIHEEVNPANANEQGASTSEESVQLKYTRHRSKRIRKLSSLEEDGPEQLIHGEGNRAKANEGASTSEESVLFKDTYGSPERTRDVPCRENHHLESPLLLTRRKAPEDLDVYDFRSEFKKTRGSKRVRKRPSLKSLYNKDRPAQPIHKEVNRANANQQGASTLENNVQLRYSHHERVRKLASLEESRPEQLIHEEGNRAKANESASTLDKSVLFKDTYGSPERTRDVPYRENHHHLGSPLFLPRQKEPEDLDVHDFRSESSSSKDIQILRTRVHDDEEDSDEELILSRRSTDCKYKNKGQAYRFKLTFGLKDEDIKKAMSIPDPTPISYLTATANLLWDEFMKKRNSKK